MEAHSEHPWSRISKLEFGNHGLPIFCEIETSKCRQKTSVRRLVQERPVSEVDAPDEAHAASDKQMDFMCRLVSVLQAGSTVLRVTGVFILPTRRA